METLDGPWFDSGCPDFSVCFVDFCCFVFCVFLFVFLYLLFFWSSLFFFPETIFNVGISSLVHFAALHNFVFCLSPVTNTGSAGSSSWTMSWLTLFCFVCNWLQVVLLQANLQCHLVFWKIWWCRIFVIKKNVFRGRCQSSDPAYGYTAKFFYRRVGGSATSPEKNSMDLVKIFQ